MSLVSPSRGLALTVLLALAAGSGACAAPAEDGAEAASSEAALSSLPTGHFEIERAPSRGSYVKSLTLKAGKKYELEYVRVRETTKPWAWNPWIPVPSREETKLSLEGTYFLYESDGPRVAFETSETGPDGVDVGLTVSAGRLGFTTTDGTAYALKSAAAPVDTTKPFVADCKARFWEGTLRLEKSGHRRGTLSADRRLTGANNSTPEVGKFAIAYTGDTGVEDYMGFEGADDGENKVDFALKRGAIEGRAGSTFDVGLGYSRKYTSYYVHQSMTCTVR